MPALTGRALVAAMCLGQVGSLLPHVVVPAIMAQHLMPLWHLSAARAGLMASAYAFGYMLALKALADRLPAGDLSRSITLYTGSFSIGVGLSFLVSQLVADAAGWRAAFYVTSAGPFIMVAVCLWLAPCKPAPAHGHLLDFRPVLRNRAALGYILGYGAHCFELYGMRTWIVAFWAFVVAQSDDGAFVGPITVSVIVTLLSLPASVLGNEAALRFGRHRAITAVMVASAAVALAIGLNVGSSPLLLLALVLVYGFTIPADSGALTSGTTASAAPAYRGATLALHSTVGFGLSALGGWGAGIALDAAGGPEQPAGWSALFALLAAGVLFGPIALRWSRQGRVVTS